MFVPPYVSYRAISGKLAHLIHFGDCPSRLSAHGPIQRKRQKAPVPPTKSFRQGSTTRSLTPFDCSCAWMRRWIASQPSGVNWTAFVSPTARSGLKMLAARASDARRHLPGGVRVPLFRRSRKTVSRARGRYGKIQLALLHKGGTSAGRPSRLSASPPTPHQTQSALIYAVRFVFRRLTTSPAVRPCTTVERMMTKVVAAQSCASSVNFMWLLT